MTSKNDYALITGSSMGIGKEIAKELSRRNINTLLVALNTPELDETRKFIAKEYATKVDSYGIDLTKYSAADEVYDWCSEKGYRVSILVNNAGFGESGYFENVAIERYCKMIDLNNKAVVSLTHKFLPGMKMLDKSHIMNISSMEATLPLPYKAVYTGTKNFLYAYSLALNEEIRRFGVKMTIVCPGSVLTNEGGVERIKAQGAKAKLLLSMPDEVAKIAVKNMLNGMLVSNPGKMNWWITRIAKFIPTRMKMRILEKIFSAYK